MCPLHLPRPSAMLPDEHLERIKSTEMLIDVVRTNEPAIPGSSHPQAFVGQERADDRAAYVARPDPHECDTGRPARGISSERTLLGSQHLHVEIEPSVDICRRHDAMVNPADGASL